ncbi:MAG TPA: FAD-dependent oxidoreductase [Polyangiaceae bacterium]
MSGPRVVVVGAGVAGTAAAWFLARGGARVSVLFDRAGSSALMSGAVDGGESAASSELDADARAFVEALGLWKLGPTTVATREGVVRTAAGADLALLDLEPLAGKHVAVADVPRDDWDGPLLVEALVANPWAERTRTKFSLVPVSALRRGHERRIASHDFASLHDDSERLAALAQLLVETGRGHDAWLLGPWLGVKPGTASLLRRTVPVPVGETTSFVGGAAGARFDNAREALLGARSIEVVRARVESIEPRGDRWAVGFVSGDERERNDELEAAAVVMATGGVAAGGIAFVWEPERGANGFRLSFAAPVALCLDGQPGDSGGSLYGPSLEARGLGVLERVGVVAGASGIALRGKDPVPGLYVAGDALAGRPRTVLDAVVSGIRAARDALLKAQG